MKKMKSILSSHKIVVICLAVLMTLTFTYVSVSFAKSETLLVPEKQSGGCLWYQRTVYYTDASYTTSTGVVIFFCDGEVGHAGTTSPYFVITTCECIEE